MTPNPNEPNHNALPEWDHLCRTVLHHCPDTGFGPYAKSYASQGLHIEDSHGRAVQALYILSNLTYWRGPHAQLVRAGLKEWANLAKHLGDRR